MKKLFLAFALLLFTSTTFAFTLTGTIADKLDQTGLEEVQIALNGKSEDASEDGGVFSIPNIDITAGNPAKIVFSKDAYLDLAGTITQKRGVLYLDGVRFGSVKYKIPQGGGVAIPDPDATYTLFDIELLPNPVPIIRGKITAIRGRDEMEQDLIWSKVKIYASENGETLKVDKETEGEYTVLGYLGTADIPRYLTVTFEYPGYKDVYKYFDVEATIKDENTDIVFEEQTLASKQEENLTNITGFGCNELMPRYLVGANCVENNDLKGDATDIAFFLQKFGTKITSLMGLVAVAMIVYTDSFTKFKTWRKFASYCGIAPFPNSSGTSIRGKNKVSNLANKKIKSLLDLCAK